MTPKSCDHMPTTSLWGVAANPSSKDETDTLPERPTRIQPYQFQPVRQDFERVPEHRVSFDMRYSMGFAKLHSLKCSLHKWAWCSAARKSARLNCIKKKKKFFVAVPSTVPTSEALLPRRSSQHPSPPATPRAHSASRPRPQRSTGSDVRSLVGCHPKETLHCCWVTSVVFSSACSDSTYAGHHLLFPLLTTMLAKSRSQTEWLSPKRADRRYVPPPILLCGLSDIEGFDQNCPRQGRREEHQDWGHHESVTWRATEADTFFLFFNLCSDRWGWGWYVMMLWRSILVWDYLTGPQTTLTVTIIPVLTRPGNCGTCSVGQVIRTTPSKMHPLSGWSSAVWFQPSHWAHSTPSSG